MPRGPRLKSETGIYHIMIKSSSEWNAFSSESNKLLFLEVLLEVVNSTKCVVYAYCIMDNHIHLVINEIDQDISKIMNILQSKYSKLYRINNSYEGNVFTGRFRSEPIETDDYLFAVIRYVHNNPVQAQMVESASRYRWSSYNSYINNDNRIIDTRYFLDYFSERMEEAVADYIEFHDIEDKIKPIEY